MASDADRKIGARREEILMAEVNSMREKAALGLGVIITGGDNTYKAGAKWL